MQRHVYRRVVHNRLSLHGGLAGALRRSLSAPLAPLVRAARRPAGAARHHPRACSPRACPKRLLPARLLSAHPLPLARSSTRCAPARCAPARLAAVELLMDCRGGWGGGGDLRWLLAGGAAKVEDSRRLPSCGPRRRAAAQLAPLAGLPSAPPRCSTARFSDVEKLFQVRSMEKFRHGDGLRRPCPQHRPRQPWPARAGKSASGQ